MFDRVAAKYDRTNDVLSLGNSLLWRVATTRAVNPQPGERILDIAAGTGTSSASLAKSGADIVAADFSPGMIEVGRQRQAHVPNLSFTQADAMALPFGDDEFDAVTISFGLRNVKDPQQALREFLRVTKPGGRLVVCEFSRPTSRAFQAIYNTYQRTLFPPLARLAGSDKAAYDYLVDSIAAWPAQSALADQIRDAGWSSVAWRNLSMGIVALHRGVKALSSAG